MWCGEAEQARLAVVAYPFVEEERGDSGNAQADLCPLAGHRVAATNHIQVHTQFM